MNIAGLRSSAEPRMVLFQSDLQDPMNPHGLLIAYAEATVKPVVSDFDAFLVGSRGMQFEALPSDQADLMHWTLRHAQKILAEPGPQSWTSRWLEVLRRESEG